MSYLFRLPISKPVSKMSGKTKPIERSLSYLMQFLDWFSKGSLDFFYTGQRRAKDKYNNRLLFLSRIVWVEKPLSLALHIRSSPLRNSHYWHPFLNSLIATYSSPTAWSKSLYYTCLHAQDIYLSAHQLKKGRAKISFELALDYLVFR